MERDTKQWLIYLGRSCEELAYIKKQTQPYDTGHEKMIPLILEFQN